MSVTEDYYFHTDGSFSVTLPVGEARLEAWRGFEYEPVSRTVDVRAGEFTTVEVQLDRWIDMAADGWYSGDNHIHPNYGGHYFRHPRDLRNKAHSEDLNVANGMIANYWGNSRVEDLEHFLGHPHPHTGPRTVVYYNEEYRPSFFAHLSLLNLVELITPFYIGSVGTAHHALYPDNAHVLRRVHEQGGIGGYVHPFGLRHRDPDEAGAGSARELPVDAILGVADFVDVACIWSDELGTAEIWYRLLNTGSRIPATAGTDVMSDIWRHPAVGTTRTYVYTGEDHLHYDAWADSIAAGRAFVTSGPMLTLDVSGMGMGEELGCVTRRRGEGRRNGAVALHDAPPRDRPERPDRAHGGRDRRHEVDRCRAGDPHRGVRLDRRAGAGSAAARGHGQLPLRGTRTPSSRSPTASRSVPVRTRRFSSAGSIKRWANSGRWTDGTTQRTRRKVLATFEEGRRLYQAQVDGTDGSRWTEETAAGGRSDRFPRGMVPVGQHAQVVRLHARHLGSEDLA